MPAQFALTALIGVFAARISRSVFTVSRASALAIACIVVSGPFFRYVAGHYFLSTLMSTPILLYLLWTTVTCRSRGFLDAGLAIRFGSAYVLLLFIYPFLFFAGVAAQMAAIVLTLIAEFQSGGGGWPLDIISPLALLGLPGTMDHVQVERPADRIWAVTTFCVIALALGGSRRSFAARPWECTRSPPGRLQGSGPSWTLCGPAISRSCGSRSAAPSRSPR